MARCSVLITRGRFIRHFVVPITVGLSRAIIDVGEGVVRAWVRLSGARGRTTLRHELSVVGCSNCLDGGSSVNGVVFMYTGRFVSYGNVGVFQVAGAFLGVGIGMYCVGSSVVACE